MNIYNPCFNRPIQKSVQTSETSQQESAHIYKQIH